MRIPTSAYIAQPQQNQSSHQSSLPRYDPSIDVRSLGSAKFGVHDTILKLEGAGLVERRKEQFQYPPTRTMADYTRDYELGARQAACSRRRQC